MNALLRTAAVAAAALCALASGSDASAQSTDDVIRARAATAQSGEVVVTFRGDPATCAGAGLCDVEGTTRWSLPSTGQLSVSSRAKGRRGFLLTTSSGSDDTATVVRRAVPGGTRVCSDAGQEGTTYDPGAIRVGPGGDATVRLLTEVAPILGGRCIGPALADLVAAFPSVTLDADALARGSRRLDLRGERGFAAGGLTGTVRSTVVIDVGRMHAEPVSPGAAGRGDDVRGVTVRYRVARIDGAVRIAASGPADRGRCLLVDGCGARFETVVEPRVAAASRQNEVQVVAYAPRSVPRRALLVALGLRAGRPDPRVQLTANGGLQPGGRATTTAVREGGAVCRDTAPAPTLGLLGDPFAAAPEVRLVISPGPLSRCGGPVGGSAIADFVGGVARADLTPALLRRDGLVLDFSGRRTIADPFFPMRVAPDLRVVLTRVGGARDL